jgi:hypothetical protein
MPVQADASRYFNWQTSCHAPDRRHGSDFGLAGFPAGHCSWTAPTGSPVQAVAHHCAAVVAQGHEGVAATAKTRRNRQGDPSCAELPEGGALERELAQRVGEPPGTSSDPRYASVLLSRWHS